MPADAMHVLLPGQLKHSRHVQHEVDRICCSISTTPRAFFVALMDNLLDPSLLSADWDEETSDWDWAAAAWRNAYASAYEKCAREGLLCQECILRLVKNHFMPWVVQRKLAGTLTGFSRLLD